MRLLIIRIQLLVVLGLSLLVGISWSEDASIRVATYNLRNYLSMDRLVDGSYRPDYPKPESEKAILRATIREAAPDVLAVQEIGERAHLLELKRDLAAEGLEYDRLFILEAEDDTRRVGALWKDRARIQAVGHVDLTIQYLGERQGVKRGLLELRILDENDKRWASVFTLHLKSKYTNDKRDYQSNKRRALEAQAARDRVLELYPDPSENRFLIVGDLNDGPNTSVLKRFYQKGRLAIAEPLECRDDYGLIWTHFYKKGGEYAQIDYILASVGWQEAKSFSTGIVTRDDYYKGSDHRLVWVDVSAPESVVQSH